MSAHSETVPLNATTRTTVGKQVRGLRREGQIPAVLYGNHIEAIHLSVDAKEFESVLHKAGSNTLVSLKVGGDKAVKALIHSIQRAAGKVHPLHADFYQVNLKEKLRTNVPIEIIGVAPVVDMEEGTLVTVRDEIEIECLPDNLIHSIQVDISVLATVDDSIRISDLTVPENVTIVDDPESVVIAITAMRSEAELEALEEKPEEPEAPIVENGGDEPVAEDGATEDKKKGE